MNRGFWNNPELTEDYVSGRVFSEADRFILNRLGKLNPEILVELGCGPGVVAKRAGFIQSYISTDVSMGFLRKLNSDTSVCCSGSILPFRSSFSSCVLAMAVLHHFDCEVLQDALREIHRILRPGGVFILLEDWCFARGKTPFEEEARKFRFRHGTRENHLAEGTWTLELQAAGFTCRKKTWARRPFRTTDSRLLRWAERDRTVRMLCLESVRH